jgi:hypothetical protein
MDQITALQSRGIGKKDDFCRNAGKNRWLQNRGILYDIHLDGT